ncbi:MAG: ABC transporter permease [Bacteroidetes bacterium]|nr:MAG: ABC transporter permease [Bacteroidota bacterium]
MITNETRKEFGKFLIDVSKLVLGGVVFASVVKSDDLPKTYVMVLGLLTILLFAAAGFALINKSTK